MQSRVRFPNRAIHLFIGIETFVVINQLGPQSGASVKPISPPMKVRAMDYVKARSRPPPQSRQRSLLRNVERSRRNFRRLMIAKRYPSHACLTQRFSDAVYVFTAVEVLGLIKCHQRQIGAQVQRGQSLY